MSKSIALLVDTVTHTFTYDRTLPNGEEIFTVKTGPLLGRMRIRSKIAPNQSGSVNRCRLIVDVPKVVDEDGINAGIQPKVAFTQVWSQDVSVVTFSDVADRALLYGVVKALGASPEVSAMIQNGSNLSA
ncbi:MAG: putative coat protein [Leviviridae sp.]|nr:MAG: putative coat protein [Leviviridae sp.]